jgi:PAS domain-containing protein
MASRAHTRTLSQHLYSLMEENQLKLEYVAASADIGIETVRRVKNGDVTKLWDRTARKLADFIQRESGGLIQLTDSESTINQPKSDIFRHLVESNMDGIYLIQDKRIIYSNSRVEAMTGYSSDELSAAVYTRFLYGESRKRE